MCATQMSKERSASNNRHCITCNSKLPSYALYCSVCGERLDKGTGKMRWPWLWPVVIILSAISTSLVTFTFTDTALRPAIVMSFLFVCPGMAIVRLFRLREVVVEWILAFALSFAIDGSVAGIGLYARRWSPSGILGIVIGLSVGGAMMQLVTIHSTITSLPKQPDVRTSQKFYVVLTNLCILLIGIVVGTGLWTYAAYQSARPVTQKSVLPHQTTSHPAAGSKATTLSTSSPITSAVDTVIVMDNVNRIGDFDPQGNRYTAAQLFVNLAPDGDRVGIVRISSAPTTIKILGLQDIRSGSDKELIKSKLSSNFFGPVDPNPTAYFTPALQTAGDMLRLAAAADRKYIIIFTDALALSGDREACPASPDAFHNWFCTVAALQQQGISVVLFGFTQPGSEAGLQPTKQYLKAHGGTALQVNGGVNFAQYLTQAYSTMLTHILPTSYIEYIAGQSALL